MRKKYLPLVFAIIVLTLAVLSCSLGGKEAVPLGENYQSDEGGFILQKLEGYEFEDVFGILSMTAPDAESDAGPLIMVMGGFIE